jgi:hypothetical protein
MQRGMVGWLVLASACAPSAASPGGAPPRPAPVAPAPPPAVAEPEEPEAPRDRVREAIRTAEKRAASARRLALKEPLDIQFVTRAQYVDFVLKDFDEAATRTEADAMIALRALPLDFDVKALWVALAQDPSHVGSYDAEQRRMLVVEDAAMQECVLTHEAIHGLQSQHFDLGKLLGDKTQTADAREAIQMLAEADANSVPCEPEAGAPSPAPAATAPAIPDLARFQMSDSQTFGASFVRLALDAGGFEKLDAIWREPPTTTEQVMHFDLYERKEPAVSVSTPAPPALRGWTVAHEQVWGELWLASVLGAWRVDRRLEAAGGWAGDRMAVFTKAPNLAAVAWRIRFDDDGAGKNAQADEAYAAIREALTELAPLSKIGGLECSESAELGPLAIGRRRRDVVVLAGPYARDGTTLSSASKCAAAASWGARVLAGKP